MKLKIEKLSIADLKIAMDLIQKEIQNLNLKTSKNPKEVKELNKYTLIKNLILDELKYRIKKIVE